MSLDRPALVPGAQLLDAMAELLYRASVFMISSSLFEGDKKPSKSEEKAWLNAIEQIDAAEEACRRRLPIGGADYMDALAEDLRELLEERGPVGLVPRGTRRMLYAALAMLPALRRSMQETTTERNRNHTL